ncbi:MAG: NmrA family NAD(P)-binding protein, partial [Planctomycetes bacterium]|nr:NmrA family NAD(P)-binding protein [Planctomycetota bacterium]
TSPFGYAVDVHRLNFDNPKALAASFEGVTVFYNTYWVRFNHRSFTQADAVRHTITIFDAAGEAGVERIVHVSITNPQPDSALEYFRSKAQLEAALAQTGVSRAILRPAVLFGRQDILINNIAWMLRRLPVMGVFGDGQYRLQPIHVDDLVELAVQQGESRRNTVIDAIGPETFAYRGLIEQIGQIIGRRRPIISVPPWLGYLAAKVMGTLVDDVILTRPEI